MPEIIVFPLEASNCLKRKTPFENYNQSNLESQTSEKINLTTHTQTKKTCIKTSNKGEIEEQHKLNSNEFLHKASKNELQTEKTKAKDSKKGQNVSVSEKKSKKHKKEKKRHKDKSPSSKANRQPLHLEFQQLVEATLKNSDNQQVLTFKICFQLDYNHLLFLCYPLFYFLPV